MPAFASLRSSAVTLTVLLSACVGPTEVEEANTLTVAYIASATYPAGILRFAGGPNDDVQLNGATFRQHGSRHYSDSIPIPARGPWSSRAALISPAGDTLAVVSATISLEPGRIVDVGLLARPSLAGLFICYPIVARAPISVSGAASDTLYFVTLSFHRGDHLPVC